MTFVDYLPRKNAVLTFGKLLVHQRVEMVFRYDHGSLVRLVGGSSLSTKSDHGDIVDRLVPHDTLFEIGYYSF